MYVDLYFFNINYFFKSHIIVSFNYMMPHDCGILALNFLVVVVLQFFHTAGLPAITESCFRLPRAERCISAEDV